MKLMTAGLVLLAVSAHGAAPIDLGITPVSDSLQAKLEAVLQAQFEEEERGGGETRDRLVTKAREGGFQIQGSNGVLTCREYSPQGTGFLIQIQQYGCQIETR